MLKIRQLLHTSFLMKTNAGCKLNNVGYSICICKNSVIIINRLPSKIMSNCQSYLNQYRNRETTSFNRKHLFVFVQKLQIEVNT